MNQWMDMLTKYEYTGILILLLLQMILVISAIHMLRRLKRHVEMIQNKVTDYLAVVMEEETVDETEPQTHVVSEQERRMVESLARKKELSQEEIFNAVLQEIFP